MNLRLIARKSFGVRSEIKSTEVLVLVAFECLITRRNSDKYVEYSGNRSAMEGSCSLMDINACENILREECMCRLHLVLFH